MTISKEVRHRIDGLETQQAERPRQVVVRHRIDGLEIIEQQERAAKEVRHRIDGLENPKNQ